MADESHESGTTAKPREPKYDAAGWRERNRQLEVSKHVVAAVFVGDNAEKSFTEAGMRRELEKLQKHEAQTSAVDEEGDA